MMTNRIQGTTILTGLLGFPLKHSRSPHMHNSAFEKLELDYAYLAFEVEEGFLEEGLNAMKTFNAKGFNVTMPHKEKVIEFLDEVSEDAKIIGSVNTVLNDNGKLIGYNTDGRGFVKALEESNVEYKGKKIVMVGAGGAAKAVAVQLAFDGAKEVVIMNRTLSKAEDIMNSINGNIPTSGARALEFDEVILKEELKDSAILVNCTPIGMKNTIEQCIVSNKDTLHKDLFVADIIYDPLQTKLMSTAEELGCKTMNGINMMIYQGALAFRIWTGEEMPIKYIKDVLFQE